MPVANVFNSLMCHYPFIDARDGADSTNLLLCVWNKRSLAVQSRTV